MKLFKGLAVVLTIIMIIVSITAMVDASGRTFIGSSVVVWDNSERPPEIISIVLPTIPADTYKGKIDPFGLLHTFNPVLYPNHRVFFSKAVGAGVQRVATVAGLEAAPRLYAVSYVEDVLYAEIKPKITFDAAGTVILNSKNFAVWVPVTNNPLAPPTGRDGEGRFFPLCNCTVENYFRITRTGGVLNTFEPILLNRNEKGRVFDGKVYMQEAKELTNFEENLIHVKLEETAPGGILGITGTHLPLYVRQTNGLYITIEEVIASNNFPTIKNYSDILLFNPGTKVFSNESATATIINKSSGEVVVDVEVIVHDFSGGLTFSPTPSFPGNEMVYFALVTDSDEIPVQRVKNAAGNDLVYGKASHKFTLQGVKFDTVTYQSNEIADITLGPNYYQYRTYRDPYDFETASFFVVGDANPFDAAAWNKYIANLTQQANELPQIEVIFGVYQNDQEVWPPLDIGFTFGDTVNEFYLVIASDDPLVFGNNRNGYFITIFSSDGSSNALNMTHVSVRVSSDGKMVKLVLPDWVELNGWSKIIITGSATNFKRITLEKEGPDAEMGPVTMTPP